MVIPPKQLSKEATWRTRLNSAFFMVAELIFAGLVLLGVAAIYTPAAIVLAGLAGIYVVERGEAASMKLEAKK